MHCSIRSGAVWRWGTESCWHPLGTLHYNESVKKLLLLLQDCNNYVGFEDEIKSSYVYQADGVFPSKGGGGGKKVCLSLLYESVEATQIR